MTTKKTTKVKSRSTASVATGPATVAELADLHGALVRRMRDYLAAPGPVRGEQLRVAFDLVKLANLQPAPAPRAPNPDGYTLPTFPDDEYTERMKQPFSETD